MKQTIIFPKFSAVLILAGLVTLSSCKKDNNSTATSDSAQVTEAVQSDAVAEDQFNDVFNITMGLQASDAGEDVGIGSGAGVIYRPTGPDGTLSPDSMSRCFTVTVSPKTRGVFPKTAVLDFGTGCLGKDGKMRSGKITSVYTGPMFVSGSSVTTTFDNYNVDSFKVEGTHTIQNKSTANKFSWSATVAGGKITNTQNNFWRKWDGTRDHEQVTGNSTPLNLLDDSFSITGNATGSNSNNNSWTSTITQPLIRKFTCRWIDSGKVQITRNANPDAATIDFGDGTCDAKATITYKGVVYNISLR